MNAEVSCLAERAVGEDEVAKMLQEVWSAYEKVMLPDVPADKEWQEVHQIVVPKIVGKKFCVWNMVQLWEAIWASIKPTLKC